MPTYEHKRGKKNQVCRDGEWFLNMSVMFVPKEDIPGCGKQNIRLEAEKHATLQMNVHKNI